MEVKFLGLPWLVEVFSFFALLLAAQSIAALRDGFRFLHYVRSSRLRPVRKFSPRAAVIIPCKGMIPGFEENLSRFMTQDYPAYQLIFVVATAQDPAHAALLNLLENVTRAGVPRKFPPPRTVLLEAGLSEVRGEKVNNLLCGLTAVDSEASVLAFADADARPGEDWLRALVAPLADKKVTVSTGFRWYLPGTGFVSQLRAAWDTSIATLLGEHRDNFAWGGSMALRAEDFKRLRIAERYWACTVSDDYGVYRAVRDARGWIRFEPRCLVASREDSSFLEFIHWSNRQIILTRVYAVRFWTLGLAANCLYCGTFLWGLVLLLLPGISNPTRMTMGAMLLAILVLGFVKGNIRTVVAREIFPEEQPVLSRLGSRYWQLTPLVPWIMLFNFMVAGLTRRIEWSGSRYELKSVDEVKVLGRDVP
ncbi:MAG TPA: glycosyltransferase [Terriglobia bacterium]|nr:glycosyltransferase [Terriglobia bacterium]